MSLPKATKVPLPQRIQAAFARAPTPLEDLRDGYGKPYSAEALAVFAEARRRLAIVQIVEPPAAQAPYPWCHKPGVCTPLGRCTSSLSCGN